MDLVLLDGPMGTELERRGVQLDLPLWSAGALTGAEAIVAAIHDDYLAAGARILTACTFRTSPYTLSKVGRRADAERLTRRAVELARAAADRGAPGVLVAGSIAPLEDCYSPGDTPPGDVLAREHAMHSAALAAAGVDLLLVETVPTGREALAACAAAAATGLPVLLSLLPRRRTPGDPGIAAALVANGDSIAEVTRRAAAMGVAGVLVNCGPPDVCEAALGELAQSGVPTGIYPNAGDWAEAAPDVRPKLDPSGRSRAQAPTVLPNLAEAAVRWARSGAHWIGGCCGTTPADLARIARALAEGPW